MMPIWSKVMTSERPHRKWFTSCQSPRARAVGFNHGGRFVSFVMSECEGSSTVSEVSSDNLILAQEVFGECLLNHFVSTATRA